MENPRYDLEKSDLFLTLSISREKEIPLWERQNLVLCGAKNIHYEHDSVRKLIV